MIDRFMLRTPEYCFLAKRLVGWPKLRQPLEFFGSMAILECWAEFPTKASKVEGTVLTPHRQLQ
jgi:hypothetical protein